MTDKHDKQPTTDRNTGQAIALGAVLLGILCIVAGIWLLNRTPNEAVLAAATPALATAAPAPTRALAPTVARPTNTVVLALTPTLPPDVQDAAPTPTATSIPLQSGLFHLAILHSNDTWGYLMPCG